MAEGQIHTPERPSFAPPEVGPVDIESKVEHPTPSVDTTMVHEVVPITPIIPVNAQPMMDADGTTSALTKRVEDIMVAGLAETYAQLDPATQAKFKAEGERTAGLISDMLATAKIHVKKIVDLLVAWLRIVPGVNKYFLEQEAKIKADKLLALKKKS